MTQNYHSLLVCFLAASAAHAQTVVDFNNLTGAVQDDVTPANTANLLNVAGVGVDGTILNFTRTLDGNDYIYSITYAGADYDGDTNNDSLTLDVRVSGFNGGSIVAPNTNNATTGSAVVGTNDVSVNPAYGGGDNSFAVNGSHMNAGETLVFSVDNISLSGASGYGATFDGFKGFQINETNGTHHRVAIGVGTDLLVKRTVGNLDSNGDFGQTLYLSAADNSFRNEQFGIRLIDFDLTVLENFVFDGSTDTDWATTDNWSGGTAPNSAGARVVFDGVNGTQTFADLNGGSFTVGELQVIDPATATSIQSSSASSVLTLSPSSIGVVMSEATKDFTFDGTTGEAWTLALGGSQTWNVDSTQAAGDLISDSGVTIDLGANTLTTNVGTGREVSIAGEVTGTGGITKTGVGTTILSGTNTYTGATTVNAGTLQVGNTQALGVNAEVKVSNGVLKLDGNSITIGSLTGAGTNDGSAAVVNDNVSAATLTVGGGGATASFDGVIADGAAGGALSLTKTGTGTQTLTGTNTYTGATMIEVGTLLINGDNSGATGAFTVSTGASLGGSGTVGGATTISGSHNVGDPSVNSGVGSQAFDSSLTYATGATFNWDLNADSTVTGFDTISGAGATIEVASGSTFNILLGATAEAGILDTMNVFWNTPDGTQTWAMSDIFGAPITGTFDNVTTNIDVSSKGSFTINNSTLTWTAVPEPSIALLAGMFFVTGLFHRRRA